MSSGLREHSAAYGQQLAEISLVHYDAAPSKSNFRMNAKGWRLGWERIKKFEEALGYLALHAGANLRYRKMPVEISVVLVGQKLDVDNSTKVIGDALEGVCYENDRQVFRWVLTRVRDEYACSPRVEVTVRWYAKEPVLERGVEHD